jgi:hypothetical protein
VTVCLGRLLRQWLLIVMTVAGLVAMHNLVGVMPMPTGVSMAMGLLGGHHPAGAARTENVSLPSHAHIAATAGMSRTGASADAHSQDAVMAAQVVPGSGDCGCPECVMGHPCQAVHADSAPGPGATVWVLSTGREPAEHLTGYPVTSLAARAPPTTTVRLAELSVWRN